MVKHTGKASATMAVQQLDAVEDASPYDTLRYALREFGDDLRIACSFGVEDMVVLHEASRAAHDLGVTPRVFLLDTGRLHQETYDLVERARQRYGVSFEIYAPDTLRVEDLVRNKGPNSFYGSVDDRRECCAVRKLGPLSRALRGARAWVTGLRREQGPTRADVQVLERDMANGGIFKWNPLAHWSTERVWAFARAHHVPTHALHAQGYPSIGCAPCTRAIAEGEDPRAGRWWWEDPDHKECGLHARRAS
jgi:phosphoadenosine phosphosulfate reductase